MIYQSSILLNTAKVFNFDGKLGTVPSGDITKQIYLDCADLNEARKYLNELIEKGQIINYYSISRLEETAEMMIKSESLFTNLYKVSLVDGKTKYLAMDEKDLTSNSVDLKKLLKKSKELELWTEDCIAISLVNKLND